MMIDRQDVRRAGSRFWQLIAIGSVGLWVLVAMDDRIAGLLTTRETLHTLVVKSLEFKDGEFHQIVVPKGTSEIRGKWSADISQGSRYICGGGDEAPYGPRATPLTLSPDLWTDDDCSAMRNGEQYTASAVWENYDQYGNIQRVSRQFDFTAEGLPE